MPHSIEKSTNTRSSDRNVGGFPTIPEFTPHPLLRGGHRQTIAGMYLPNRAQPVDTRQHVVDLDDGDQLALHENQSTNWRPDGNVALLAHGVSGCHGSPYMVRVAKKLQDRGGCCFRLDARGCGAGAHLAKNSTHAGRSEDVIAALAHVRKLYPEARISLVGFSLGGAHVLKALSEANRTLLGHVDGFVVSPPVDLLACSRQISRTAFGFYDRRIARWLYRQIVIRRDRNDRIAALDGGVAPNSIYKFDDQFTAPLAEFDNADHYYRVCSTAAQMDQIDVPLQLIVAQDDPMIPLEIFQKLKFSATTKLHSTRHGGHLGFIGASSYDPDRRWMDWRVVNWVMRETCTGA